MYQFKSILKMDLTNIFTNPMWWFYTIGLPFLLTLIMGFLTSSSYGSFVTSYDYYGITILIFSALNTATLAANSFMETRILKANMRLCNAPIRPFFIYLPKILASVIFGVFCQTLVAMLLHFTVAVNYGNGNTILFLWLLLLIGNLFAASFSVMLCCLLKNEEAVNQLLSNLITILCLFGSVFFPLKGLGNMITTLSNLSPVTWIQTMVFQIVYDHCLTLFLPICLSLIVGTVLSIGLSTKWFIVEDYL